jgi:hypothetical protein
MTAPVNLGDTSESGILVYTDFILDKSSLSLRITKVKIIPPAPHKLLCSFVLMNMKFL